MKTIGSYIRLALFVLLAYLLIEYTVETGDQSTFMVYPIAWLVFGVAVLVVVALEIAVEALNSVLYKALPEDKKLGFEASQAEESKIMLWLKDTYHKMLDKKPIENEDEIILDHNYDGIKELDNNLPPWWTYLFYATIIFAVVYMVRFHIFVDYTQHEEFEMELAQAEKEIEEYKRTAKDLIDINTVTLLTDASDLKAGENLYMQNCIACHKADGGGSIGPNLTDEYWILGGGVKNVFKTISEGGRDGKGMVAWKQTLKPLEMAQVASYVISLGGTNPEGAKEPQGDLWAGNE
jgi:cytochrome c oxidase cbb3-type subunit 3